MGEGKYAIVRHQNQAELAYILELPEEPGEAQKEFGIEKEASYIVTVINPAKPVPDVILVQNSLRSIQIIYSRNSVKMKTLFP